MMSDSLRRQLIETALAMNASGLNQGTSGNLSVRCEDGFLITPSRMDYASLSVEDIVWMDVDGNTRGSRKPSSEWRFHAAIYQHKQEANAVLHAHPVHCSALACLNKGIPAFHYMVAIAGGRDIRCAEYATFGTGELSGNVIAALKDRKACLMSHHGLTCYENDLPTVLELGIEVENLATVYSRILTIGEAEILSDREMDLVIEKFGSYGNQGA
jgi:L-fuculose-phosphate aldolase